MSIHEFSPVFQWGFSVRRPRHLVPILNSNLIVFGQEAVSGAEPHRRMFEDCPSHSSPLLEKTTTGTTNERCINLLNIPPNTEEKEETEDIPRKKNIKPINMKETRFTHPLNTPATSPRGFVPGTLHEISDADIVQLINDGAIPLHALESALENDCHRAASIRKSIIEKTIYEINNIEENPLKELPLEGFDYASVKGCCCENVIGHVSIPVGVAGPLLMNEKLYQVPLATTEGCLVASVSRGLKAITQSGGAVCVLSRSAMTRAPLVRLPDLTTASELCKFLERDTGGYSIIKKAFDETSRFARLVDLQPKLAGRLVFLRFEAHTGDAMGMNMVSKGCESALSVLSEHFPMMEIVSLSGNMCTDKKSAAVNWVEGRGRSCVSEAIVTQSVVENVLKTCVDALVDLNIQKNLVGSAVAGALGGFNAHAANIVAAVFIATGQDPAQTVESSNCITLMEKTPNGDLRISVTMPSIEVGTIGGGTHLAGQKSCLKMLGVQGPTNNGLPAGSNADTLAMVICSTVMAGELSLMSALAAGHLVKSHMKLNRSHVDLLALMKKEQQK